MKHKKTKLSVVLLVLGLTLQAQQTITTAGGDATGSGGSAAYSIGQIVYTTQQSGSDGSVTQGVQQAFEISEVLAVEDLSIDLELAAYPNPTNNRLTLNVGKGEFSTLDFQLFDIMGRLIESRKIAKRSETIQMAHLPNAMYFLKVTNTNNKSVTNFKIIKN